MKNGELFTDQLTRLLLQQVRESKYLNESIEDLSKPELSGDILVSKNYLLKNGYGKSKRIQNA